MLRALGLKRQPTEQLEEQEVSQLDVILKECHDFEVTLQAMDFVLNDQPSKGIEILESAISKEGREPIFILGHGVIQFIEATLGFEPETMKKAQETLSEAETLSSRKRAFHEKHQLKTSLIYPPGTQYAVTYAESNLLIALIMLLSESVIESAKALYKLRKAYQTLDEINKNIRIHRKKLNTPNESTSTLNSFSDLSVAEEKNPDLVFAHVPANLTEQQKKDVDVINRADRIYKFKKARILGTNISESPGLYRQRTHVGHESTTSDAATSRTSSSESFVDAVEDKPAEVLSSEQIKVLSKMNNHTIDEFIHSGVNLCFGILQVVLSLIPPAIGKVLSIVGFRGSRENGLEMLWKAAEERNIHGDIATIGLLVFYDGPFQFTDTDFDVPDIKNESGPLEIQKIESRAFSQSGEATLLHPGHRLELALLRGRAYFPDLSLWLLQEGRMLAAAGRLEEAVELMDTAGQTKPIEMTQAEALLMFDKAMILVYMHNYERAAEHFLKVIKLNSWSHAIYTYMAGCCYLECYRMCLLDILPKERTEHFKKEATKYLLKAPTYLEKNKKGFFAKQMPMDRYLLRKVAIFEKTNQKYPDLDLVDCVGTSPIHELSYFWNAYNRMDEKNLLLAQKLLGYSAAEGSKDGLLLDGKRLAKIPETELDAMLRFFLQSLVLRRLGKVEDGCKLLDDNVIKGKILETAVKAKGPLNGSDATRYIKKTEDPWLYPTALYERASFCWKLKGLDAIEEVKDWLKKAQGYADDYELSSRTGMHIKAAMDRLEGY